jgi:hypothetical protein
VILGSEKRQTLVDDDIPLPSTASGSAEIGAASGVPASGNNDRFRHARIGAGQIGNDAFHPVHPRGAVEIRSFDPATGQIDPHRTIGEEIPMLIARLPPRPARSEERMD